MLITGIYLTSILHGFHLSIIRTPFLPSSAQCSPSLLPTHFTVRTEA